MVQKIQSPEHIQQLIACAKAQGCGSSVIERLTVLHRYAEHPESITETCDFFGISRTTLANWLQRFDPNDLSSLEDRYRASTTTPAHSMLPAATAIIRAIRTETPLLGKERIAELLAQNHGINLSASTVGRIIDRECFYFAQTPFHIKKRLEYRYRIVRCHALSEHADVVRVASLHQSDYGEPATHTCPLVVERTEAHNTRKNNADLVWRSIVTLSVLTNIIFLGFLIGAAAIESWSSGSVQDAQSTSIEAQIVQPMHAAPPSDRHP